MKKNTATKEAQLGTKMGAEFEYGVCPVAGAFHLKEFSALFCA